MRLRTRSAVLAVALAVGGGIGFAPTAAGSPATAPAALAPAVTAPAVTPPAAAAPARPPVAASDVAALAVPGTDGVQVLEPGDASTGGWRELTRLWVAGWDAPGGWTENDCVTGDGRYIAVTFAPVSFANTPALAAAGAFGAVVDLRTGTRWVLPDRVTLRYHSPGCGTGDVVVFSRFAGADETVTDLLRVDAAHSRVLERRSVREQVTSAVPTGDGITAVAGRSIVSVDSRGGTRTLTAAPGAAFDLRPAASGSLDYLAVTGKVTSAAFRRSSTGAVSRLADGPLGNLSLAQGRAGANHLVGAPTKAGGIDVVRTSAPPAALSLDASLVVDAEHVPGLTTKTASTTATSGETTIVSRARAATRSTPTTVATVATAAAGGAPAVGAPVTAAPTTGSVCSVPPLDPGTQVVQPSVQQEVWAANRAVRGELTDTRPANWEKHGLGSYVPEQLIGAPAIRIPVQVLYGVMAQESNLSQASIHALAGVPGDPLIGDYYGATYSGGRIVSMSWANGDCGYGVGQVTEHMRADDPYWPASTKRAIATDYEVNLAAAVKILIESWDGLQARGITANDNDPTKIENWYMALWAYNSGIKPTVGSYTGGLGWTNNPIQNDYQPSRAPFLATSYDDAAHPQLWPYQEKVLGWAQHPQLDLVHGGDKYVASMPLQLPTNYTLFCTASNRCDPQSVSTGYCLNSDRFTCEWHAPVSWPQNGTAENPIDYHPGATEPAVTDPYPPSCSPGASPVVQTPGTGTLPAGSVVVDDLPNSAANIAGCGAVANPGSFTLDYGTQNGLPTGAIDTHQLGVGYLGHSYFSHTVDPGRADVVTTGTWRPPAAATGWRRIWVHIPDNGADTFQARYYIHPNNGDPDQFRVVNQRWNKNVWFDLGSFQLGAGATVTLSNGTPGDFGNPAIDISWDAVAFTPSAKPAVSYVALGDSYASGQSVSPYYADSDNGSDTPEHKNQCHRSPQAYPTQVFQNLAAAHPGQDEFHFVACSGAVTASLDDTSREQWGEIAQLTDGWLNSDTTLVTIQIGGNDARFATVLQDCAQTLSDCVQNGWTLSGDSAPLVDVEPQKINDLMQRYGDLFDDIRAAAPNAKIVAVGYPHVITTGDRRALDSCSVYDQDAVDWFAQMSDLIDSVFATAAANAGATFVNPVSTFAGPPAHEACVPNSANEWINAAIVDLSHPTTLLPGSFHPDANGHAAYARAITPYLP